jgi:hypothetical protein
MSETLWVKFLLSPAHSILHSYKIFLPMEQLPSNRLHCEPRERRRRNVDVFRTETTTKKDSHIIGNDEVPLAWIVHLVSTGVQTAIDTRQLYVNMGNTYFPNIFLHTFQTRP